MSNKKLDKTGIGDIVAHKVANGNLWQPATLVGRKFGKVRGLR